MGGVRLAVGRKLKSREGFGGVTFWEADGFCVNEDAGCDD